jgi:hypothetical protein
VREREEREGGREGGRGREGEREGVREREREGERERGREGEREGDDCSVIHTTWKRLEGVSTNVEFFEINKLIGLMRQ